MNQKQWKKLTHSIDKPKDFWYWRNKAVEYFNLQKGQVIHHLRDTKEQCIFNDNYYERWGFDFNEEMKYCICISKEEHSELRQIPHRSLQISPHRGIPGEPAQDHQRQDHP